VGYDEIIEAATFVQLSYEFLEAVYFGRTGQIFTVDAQLKTKLAKVAFIHILFQGLVKVQQDELPQPVYLG
jgi:hypothetical protein